MTTPPPPQAPRDLLIEQVLPDYRAWLRRVAVGMLSPTHEALDDLIQEGYIAMWRAVESFDPDAAPADYWLKRSATQRMHTVFRSGSFEWTGMPQRYNGGHGGSQPDERVLSFEELRVTDDESSYGYDVEDMDSTAAIEAVEWGYHDGEIAAAISRLTSRQQRYVHLRFVEGYSNTEMVPEFGYNPSALWTSQRNGAKKKLSEELAHLR